MQSQIIDWALFVKLKIKASGDSFVDLDLSVPQIVALE